MGQIADFRVLLATTIFGLITEMFADEELGGVLGLKAVIREKLLSHLNFALFLLILKEL